MNENRYGRAIVGNITQEDNNAGGITLNIESAYSSPEADFNDRGNLQTVAANAVRTADGLYHLVIEQYDSNLQVKPDHFEMYIALSCLACEIYMKSIIYFMQSNPCAQIKKHKLNELFDMLPDQIKERLKSRFTDIQNYILEVSDYFTTFRYDFELNAFNANLFTFDLMEELHQIAHEYQMPSMPELFYSNGIIEIK